MGGMLINYEKYIKSLDNMQESELPKVKMDMRAVVKYARRKGLRVMDLSDAEKAMFITPRG